MVCEPNLGFLKKDFGLKKTHDFFETLKALSVYWQGGWVDAPTGGEGSGG